jgi:AraC-like DNA-binding protein
VTAIPLAAASAVVDDHSWHVPPAELRPFVAVYAGFRQAGVEPMRHRGLPSPFLTVIFTLDEPLIMAAHADPHQPPASYETLVGGLHTTPALIVHDGWQSGIQLMVSPLGARALLGMPAGEVAGIDVDGEAVLGPLAGQVQDRLRRAPGWPERFAILDAFLLARLRAADGGSGVSAEVRYAWLSMLRSSGTGTVQALAAETGWSERYLRTRFRGDTGLTPKAAARVIRFHRARQQLARRAADGRRLALAELAASRGYFDQAHLDREFRSMAGCPPTTWLAEEFRNIQAAARTRRNPGEHER